MNVNSIAIERVNNKK